MIAPPDSSLLFKAVRWLALLIIALLIASWLISAPLFVYGIFNDLDSVLAQVHADAWTPEAVRAASTNLGFAPQTPAWTWFAQEVVLFITFIPMGLLLFFRKPDAVGTYLGVAMTITGTYIAGPVALSLARVLPVMGSLTPHLATLAFLSFGSMIYLFPNGRFVPAWTRYFMPVNYIAVALYSVFVENSAHPMGGSAEAIGPFIYLSFLGVGVVTQIYRYVKVSTPLEKRQTRFILLSFVLFFLIVIFVYAVVPNTVNQTLPPQPSELLAFTVMYYFVTMEIIIFMVGGLAISILRHRLYDLDLVIRRTLTYGLVTAVLALTYFGGVTVMQSLLVGITGQSNSPLVLVITTLAIAALFNPLRTRIQTIVDRRFNRRDYDIQQTLEDFNDHMRDQVDIAHIQTAILTVIQQTVEPEHIALWLTDREES